MNRFFRAAAVLLAFIPICLAVASPSHAGGNAVVNELKKTPVSVFTYGLANLYDAFNSTFADARPGSFYMFAPPLSGRIADIANASYSPKTDTITLNLVKIQKLDAGASPDDACRQAMAALRLYAGVDPATGKLQGMETSLLTVFFFVDSSPVPDAEHKAAEIDKLFRLRFNGSTDSGRFTCTADLFGTGYQMTK